KSGRRVVDYSLKARETFGTPRVFLQMTLITIFSDANHGSNVGRFSNFEAERFFVLKSFLRRILNCMVHE
ncbi:MAG: hypothetical protein ACK4IY_07935, partial [Chitinophagales bacterium]